MTVIGIIVHFLLLRRQHSFAKSTMNSRIFKYIRANNPFDQLELKDFKVIFSITSGFLVCLLIVYLSHGHLIPPTDQASFDPSKTCSSPPTGCWDALSKPHFKCVEYPVKTEIRKGVFVQKGSKNCYKSIYWNLDSTSFYMLAWFFIWAFVTSRAVESMITEFLKNNLRFPIMLGLVFSFPSVWYVTSVMIHYLNDRYFPYYHSQLYFTLSELFCQIVAILHIPNDGKIHGKLLKMMGGTALSHIIQLALDEPLIITRNLGTTFRNLALLSGDLMLLIAAWGLLGGKGKSKAIELFGICIMHLVLFRLFFADDASFLLF